MAQQTDLKKLEEKFEALFKEETEESFNKWLDKQQQINNMAQCKCCKREEELRMGYCLDCTTRLQNETN